MQASLRCFPVSSGVGTSPRAAAHPAFLAGGSLQQLYSVSAKRKQEGKGKWSYEVKTKKIKIPGSYRGAMAAGGGNSLFGESVAVSDITSLIRLAALPVQVMASLVLSSCPRSNALPQGASWAPGNKAGVFYTSKGEQV